MSGDGILGKRSDISLGLVLTNLIMHTDGRTVWKCRIVESVIGLLYIIAKHWNVRTWQTDNQFIFLVLLPFQRGLCVDNTTCRLGRLLIGPKIIICLFIWMLIWRKKSFYFWMEKYSTYVDNYDLLTIIFDDTFLFLYLYQICKYLKRLHLSHFC